MPVVKTRSRRVKDTEDLASGKPRASEAHNSDSASMKSTSDSGVDLCQDEETSSTTARRSPLKRKQQQSQNSEVAESKKRRVSKKSSALHEPSVPRVPIKKEAKPSRRAAKTSAAKASDEDPSQIHSVEVKSTKSRSVTKVSSEPVAEESQKRNARSSRGKDEASKLSKNRKEKTVSGKGRKATETEVASMKKNVIEEPSIAAESTTATNGRPRRASRAARAPTIVKTKIPKGDSDEESDVESESDFSDNDDEDFVLPKHEQSDDEIPDEVSEDDMISEAVPERVVEQRRDRKLLTGYGREKQIKGFLERIEQPSCSRDKMIIDLMADAAKVKVNIPVSEPTKAKSQNIKTGRTSKAKPKSVSDDDDEDCGGKKPSSSKARSAPKKKRELSSSDESDTAPKKAKPVKKMKTSGGETRKKTFMKPRKAPKPKRSQDATDSKSSRVEMRLLELAKQMDDSDESDDDTQDSSQAPSEVKTEEDSAAIVKKEPENDAEKKRLIMSMLKEHEEVDEMSDDSSDDDDAAGKKAPAVKKEEVKTPKPPVKTERENLDDEEKKSRKSSKKTPAKEGKKKVSKKKGAANIVKEEEVSSGSDDDDWEVVKERDPNYQRPENVTVVLKNEDFLPETKRLSMEQRMIRMINRKRKSSYLLCHRVHLMSLVGHQRILNAIADDEYVKAYALSRLPSTLAVPGKRQKDTQIVKQLLLFYKSAFELKASDEVFDPKMLKANLIKFLMKKVTTCNIVYLFGLLVLLRASEIRTRLCLSYHLLPQKAPLLRIKDGEIVEQGSKTKASDTDYGVADFFIEVYLSDKKRWRPIDIEECAIMEDPHELTPHLDQPVACLIGIDDNGCMMDLSPKYNADWLDKMKHLRSDAKFFNEVLARYAPAESEQAEEQQEVKELHELQGLPKIISQFKNHPKYALTRHLLKFEAFYPREPPVLGFVRNEPVYPRECVHTLRSKDTWHRLARQVKEGELPYSVVKARPKWNKQTESLMRDLPLEVYGEWQTEPYKPPVAENGIIPRNKFGNVELFHPDMLPIGTVHLKLPGLQRIAAELEVDCVPAVVGFDGVGRGCHPVIEGFVVCVENQEMLEEAWQERQREDRNKRRERLRKRAVKNWKKLIKKVIWDLRLKKKYKNKLEQD